MLWKEKIHSNSKEIVWYFFSELLSAPGFLEYEMVYSIAMLFIFSWVNSKRKFVQIRNTIWELAKCSLNVYAQVYFITNVQFQTFNIVHVLFNLPACLIFKTLLLKCHVCTSHPAILLSAGSDCVGLGWAEIPYSKQLSETAFTGCQSVSSKGSKDTVLTGLGVWGWW